jgi:hypothetical protein
MSDPNPTPAERPDDWTKIENVFALIEKDERKLTAGEREVIAGQRKINGSIYEAISAILATFPDDGTAPPAIIEAKSQFGDLPGREPPGCKTRTLPPAKP